METNLRQAETKVVLEGVVAEKSMAVEADKDTGIDRIRGYIVVRTSPTNLVRVNVNSSKMTKNGTESKTYAGLLTVMNEYRSIADDGEDGADIVRITNGTLNPYRSRQNGNEIISFTTNFFNRVQSKEEYNPRAEFELEGCIKSILPEVNSDGEETGRLKVCVWMPTYSGIEPIEMIAPEDIADAVSDAFEVGQTARFYGEIINDRKVTKIEIPVAIGKPKIETRTVYRNEMLITGATEPYEDKEDGDEGEIGNNGLPWAYNVDTIRKAVQEREIAIANEGNTSTAKTSSKPSGKNRGRTLGF